MTTSTNHWSKTYRALTDRNIGVLSESQQETLRQTKVAVLGLGGIGGPCFEVLVRSGIGRFSIVDKDTFDASNLNRQVYAFESTSGQKKTDVSKKFALDINPEVEIDTFEHLDVDNIDTILADAAVASFAIDELKPCVIAARKARELDIPIVEAWALPFGNVRVLNRETPTLEAAYGLPTEHRAISDISDETFRDLGMKILSDFENIDGIEAHYQPDARDRVSKGKIPSFAPIVWLSSVLLALETIKVILGLGAPALGPAFAMYDPFLHTKKNL